MLILNYKWGGYFSTHYEGKEERTGYQIACPSLMTPSKGGQRQSRSSEEGDDRG